MPGLRDIGPVTREITIRGDVVLTVRGLPISLLAATLARSAELEKALVPGVGFDALQVFKVMAAVSDDLVKQAVVCEDDERDAFAHLMPGEIEQILQAAWDISFPNGARLPWLLGLGQALGVANGAAGASGSDPGTTSSPQLMN